MIEILKKLDKLNEFGEMKLFVIEAMKEEVWCPVKVHHEMIRDKAMKEEVYNSPVKVHHEMMSYSQTL